MAAKKKKKAKKKIRKSKPKARVSHGRVKKKSLPKKALPKKKKKAKAMQRRDRPGHIDPKYAKDLRARGGKTNKKDSVRPAFNIASDDRAEELGEEVIDKATTGEDEGEEAANRDYVEEVGGPFVVTTGGEEYAEGTDESNPDDATVEPFPKT
jgi:hypothetical protein